MYDNLYSLVDINPENVHYLNPNATDLKEECDRFERLISDLGGLDLAFFGTGADGHVARNEPGSSLKSSTRMTRLAYDTRLQLSQRWSRPISLVPTAALTVGMSTIFEAGQVLVLFTGVLRAHALSSCLEGSVSHMYPVSALQKHKDCCYAADDDATFELKVKTVSYFKGIEKTSKEVFGDGIHGRGRKRKNIQL